MGAQGQINNLLARNGKPAEMHIDQLCGRGDGHGMRAGHVVDIVVGSKLLRDSAHQSGRVGPGGSLRDREKLEGRPFPGCESLRKEMVKIDVRFLPAGHLWNEDRRSQQCDEISLSAAPGQDGRRRRLCSCLEERRQTLGPQARQ